MSTTEQLPSQGKVTNKVIRVKRLGIAVTAVVGLFLVFVNPQLSNPPLTGQGWLWSVGVVDLALFLLLVGFGGTTKSRRPELPSAAAPGAPIDAPVPVQPEEEGLLAIEWLKEEGLAQLDCIYEGLRWSGTAAVPVVELEFLELDDLQSGDPPMLGFSLPESTGEFWRVEVDNVRLLGEFVGQDLDDYYEEDMCPVLCKTSSGNWFLFLAIIDTDKNVWKAAGIVRVPEDRVKEGLSYNLPLYVEHFGEPQKA